MVSNQQLKKKSYSVGVYLKKFPFITDKRKFHPLSRAEEIEKYQDEQARAQSFYAWKLLEHALQDFFGISIYDLDFTKNEYGKWLCDKVYFSISHSQNIVAVAVSSQPIGVDIEKINTLRFSADKMANILTDEERASLQINAQTLNELWAIKEAIFKKIGVGAFVPSKTNTVNVEHSTKKIKVNDVEYFLSVVGDNLSNVFFSENL